jgi:hypothetical protein
VIVVVFRIAREPGQVIALLAVQTDPLVAVISVEVVIESALAAFLAVPGPVAGAASGAVPEALMGPARALVAAGALPVWEARAAALEEAAVVAAAADLEVAVVVAAVAAGGSQS